jgi:hypothetical protein
VLIPESLKGGLLANLEQLLAAYPWLGQLGADLIARLDLAELADPQPCARALGPTVIAYRRDVPPRSGRVQLCTVVPVAQISSSRIAVLMDAERAHPGLVFVEYAPQA